MDDIISKLVERYPLNIREHVIRVSKLASVYGEDYEVLGLLHDILEDTDTLIEEVPEQYRDDLIALTRVSTETYFDYINRIINGDSKRAITIKLLDIKDHFDNKYTLKPSLEKRYSKARELLNKKYMEDMMK